MKDDARNNAGAASVGAHSKDAPHPGSPHESDNGSRYGETAERISKTVSDAADTAGAAISDGAKVAGAAASRAAGQVYERGSQAAGYAADVTRSEPLLTLLAVGAVAFLVGVTVGSSRQSSGRRSGW